VFWLGVLVTVGFTAWRLLANLKSLLRSLTELSERLAPTLQDLEAKSQETAELSARLQQRQAARQRTARPGAGRRRTGR
jgi:ABC-type transporter Mla subunit MlaD